MQIFHVQLKRSESIRKSVSIKRINLISLKKLCLISFLIFHVWEPIHAFYINNADDIPIDYGFYYGGVCVTKVGLGSNNDDIVNVVIPNTIEYENNSYNVIGIGGYSFQNLKELVSVTFPNYLTRIEQFAFINCPKLASLDIPKDVNYVDQEAFWECKGINSIIVNENNTEYDSRENCNAIIRTADNHLVFGCKNTTIPDGVISIGYYAFNNCVGLSSVIFPNSLTTIMAHAFYNCSGLSSLSIPSSILSLDGAFDSCSGLISINVEDGNPNYDSRYNCNAIIEKSSNTLVLGCVNTIIPEDVSIIGSLSFFGCNLTSITIPNNVTHIGSHAFAHCVNLVSLKIPSSVIEIGYAAFFDCQKLASTNIPYGVTSINYSTYRDCSDLTTILIPNTITSIDNGAFYGCNKLTTVAIDIVTPLNIEYINTIDNPFSNRSNATLYVPIGSKTAYESADYWKDFKEIKEMEVVKIGNEGIATSSSSADLDYTNVEGLTAYAISAFNAGEGTLTLTPVTTVKAGEGLLLKGDAGEYVVPRTTTDATYTNYLVGVPTTTSVSPTDGDYTNFVLANGTHGVNFYALSKTGNISAGKAYLKLPTANINESNLSRGFALDKDGMTSISSPIRNNDEVFYDLQGRRVNKPSKGLYIMNGKKVIIK